MMKQYAKNRLSILTMEQRRISTKDQIKKRKNEISQLQASFEKDCCLEDPQAFWNKECYGVSLPSKDERMKVPSKANYIAMNAEDRKTIQEEIKELLKKKLIRISSSSWTCSAFYMEKHSKVVRGMKRLVINYKPLNKAFKDVSHPILNKFDLIRRLKDYIVFSKFDLKSRLW